MAVLAMKLANHDESLEVAMLVLRPITNHSISEINRLVCVTMLRKSELVAFVFKMCGFLSQLRHYLRLKK